MPKKITIRGMIGWSENATPEFLSRELAAANGDDIDLEFASGGGFVMPGLEMANMVRNYSGRVVARITGVAASMSSYIPMMADEVIAEDNAIFMIHNVMGGMYGGDFRDAEKLSKHLRALRDLLAKAYVSKTGKTLEEIQQLMDDETFYYGEEISEAGFADSTIETDGDDDKNTAMALAQTEINDCVARMKESETEVRSDYERAAAYLEIDPTEASTTKPASAGKPEKEATKMTLKELLAADPAAQAEFDIAIAAAKAEGVTEGTEKMKATIDSVAPFLANDAYPPVIAATALKVLKGETSEITLTASVAAVDAVKEQSNEDDAGGEAGAETNGQHQTVVKPAAKAGELATEDDAVAAAAEMKEG